MAESFVMVSFEEALSRVVDLNIPLQTEEIPFMEGVSRVLASDLFSDISMPPFDKSAMDGYACRREDLSGELKIVETIRAGVPPALPVGEGECSRIMTGAIIPEGADWVIMVEETELSGSDRVRYLGNVARSNICRAGEDVKKGDLVLEKNTLLQTRHIPILASIGATRLNVFRQPRVAVLATGSELVEPDAVPGISQIRNSNAWQMISQLRALRLEPTYGGIAPDDEQVTRKLIAGMTEQHDLLILSGGVSMGDFDFVGEVIRDLGFSVLFDKVSIQPGKPTTFARSGDRFIFGLPGNPVSAYFTFELLVKPFIYKFMNCDWQPESLILLAGVDMTRKRANRMGWLPVSIGAGGVVNPLDYHGSAHIYALRDAVGMISIPIGKEIIKKGEPVDVRLF